LTKRHQKPMRKGKQRNRKINREINPTKGDQSNETK